MRKINLELYTQVFSYLKDHTYLQTKAEFSISEMQIARIKKYMQNQPEFKQNIPKIPNISKNSDKTKKVIQEPKVTTPLPPPTPLATPSATLLKSIEPPKAEIRMTIDGLRGLKLLTTNIGDKLSDKATLERELKQRLFNPSEFATFLKNLATYLESI